MIATVLERPSGRPDERAVQWRQLVDLLAQRRQAQDGPEIAAAYDFLRKHRAEIPLGTRERTAAALAGFPIAPALVVFFVEDHPTVAAPVLRHARLSAVEWIHLLPSLSPTGRAVLRHRRDLPGEVLKGLAAFGSTDFVLEGGVAQVADQSAGNDGNAPQHEERSQIWELVERIEAFQRNRDTAVPEAAEASEAAEEFRWETGPEGVIMWVDGAPRGPLVGQSLATIGEHGHYGVDGQAAGAFHKRSPFRDARFNVAGYGAASGDWRISGVPYFDVHRGNFLGYRGTARRPRLGEVAAMPEDAGLFGSNLPAESLRQLVHELRTPLNAIIGFAELIEGQYMGPAGSQYRGRAGEIVDQARRLLGAVDDLDTAARIETSRPDKGHGEVDAAAVLTRLREAYEQEVALHRAALIIRIDDDLPLAALEPNAAERMLSRLLAATIGLAAEGERINGNFALGRRAREDMLCLAIDRPNAIHGLDELALLHPGYSPDGDWPAAPSLGLGFALRLVRKLAEAAGGALDIGDERFMLYLPVAAHEVPADSSGAGAEA
ncbi:MAG: histidine kinase [Alphaproteobacteria bacterium]|nr:histidine kinase [Alphaproteobacteria bacterium]